MLKGLQNFLGQCILWPQMMLSWDPSWPNRPKHCWLSFGFTACSTLLPAIQPLNSWAETRQGRRLDHQRPHPPTISIFDATAPGEEQHVLHLMALLLPATAQYNNPKCFANKTKQQTRRSQQILTFPIILLHNCTISQRTDVYSGRPVGFYYISTTK